MKVRTGLCKLHQRRHSSHENFLCWIMVTRNLNNLRDARYIFERDLDERVAYLKLIGKPFSLIDVEEEPVLLAVPRPQFTDVTYNVEEE